MVTVNLIESTRTRTGLRIQAELDTSSYETGVKVTNKEFEAVRLKKDKFHGEWNYTIFPHRK
jgi:DDE family transposase